MPSLPHWTAISRCPRRICTCWSKSLVVRSALKKRLTGFPRTKLTELERNIIMSAERKKVLELLATGKITTEEAEKLLNKLDTLAGAESESAPSAFSDVKTNESKPLRYLRVEVEKPGSNDNVNVRIPLSFIR